MQLPQNSHQYDSILLPGELLTTTHRFDSLQAYLQAFLPKVKLGIRAANFAYLSAKIADIRTSAMIKTQHIEENTM